MENVKHRPHSPDARILIVDDDIITVQCLTRILEGAGYSFCLGMTDPRKAVEQFSSIRPDLVLLDWHMAGLSGAEVLARLRSKSDALTMPPVVVLTADESEEALYDALAAGATDFLTKPLKSIEMLLRIGNLLQLHRLHLHTQSETRRLEKKVVERTATLEQKVDEVREMQVQIIQQERLRALGTMAGGIAHDFNNALMVIRGYCDIYAKKSESGCTPTELAKCFRVMGLAAQDAGEIVRRLREFYRPFAKGEEDRRPIDLSQLVRESVELTRPKWETQARAQGVRIQIQTFLQPLPLVAAAAAELREAMVNLIFNAVDAMPHGGQLTLRTRAEGGRVFVECEDSGTGMTAETRLRCLEPFYTTKGEKGTGLGLAIIYGIIRRHEGTLRLDSELGKGTRITIVLPVGEVAEPSAALQLPTQSHLRVLVVDDDPNICTVLTRFLQADRHVVTVAQNGSEALEMFSPGLFDLVITDRVMPCMSGDQLATAIKAMQPNEPIILLTGFEMPASEAIDVLIRKPATLDSIRDAICLATSSEAPLPIGAARWRGESLSSLGVGDLPAEPRVDLSVVDLLG